jgi:uncharacterized protein
MLELNRDPVFVAVVIAALGFLIGATKGGFNILGALLTPLLSLILPVSQAVGVVLPMLIVGDVFALYTYWGQWDARLAWRMLPLGAVGVLIGTILLVELPTNALRIALAIFVLFVVAYKFASDRFTRLAYRPQRWHTPAVGALTGLTSALFNNGGPAFNSYLLLLKLPPRTFIATTAVFFALLNLLKVPGFLYAGILNMQLLLSVWWVFLFIPLGIWIARWLILRFDQRTFETIITALLILSSILLFVQSR